MVKVEVKEEDKELRDFADDMLLFREDPTEIQAVLGIMDDLDRTKGRFTSIGQVLNDSKEEVFMPNKSIERVWRNIQPDYKGAVGQAVVDLGVTHRVHTRVSLHKGKRVGYTSKVVNITQALAFAVRDKVTIIKIAGQSKPIYGAAGDLFTQGQLNTLRGRFATALWPK
eukprot:13854328-Heterocapsa_arctica.AAC.1